MTKQIQSREEYFIQFTDEECAELKIKRGDKFTIEAFDDGSFSMTTFAKIEIDMDQWDRETLEFLIQQSCNKDISVNEVISELLKEEIERGEN